MDEIELQVTLEAIEKMLSRIIDEGLRGEFGWVLTIRPMESGMGKIFVLTNGAMADMAVDLMKKGIVILEHTTPIVEGGMTKQ